jgi:hypothetical protein
MDVDALMEGYIMDIHILQGKTLHSIKRDRDSIIFVTDDGDKYIMHHKSD